MSCLFPVTVWLDWAAVGCLDFCDWQAKYLFFLSLLARGSKVLLLGFSERNELKRNSWNSL